MSDKALIERVRDCNTELTPADRHMLLRLIERLQTQLADAKDDAQRLHVDKMALLERHVFGDAT